jgi:hypothetical protein
MKGSGGCFADLLLEDRDEASLHFSAPKVPVVRMALEC